jgi:hypothetical protein
MPVTGGALKQQERNDRQRNGQNDKKLVVPQEDRGDNGCSHYESDQPLRLFSSKLFIDRRSRSGNSMKGLDRGRVAAFAIYELRCPVP